MANGSLAVFSPTALTPSVKSEISSFGTVKYLIASDVEHHIFLDDWHKAYPGTKIIAPEDLGPKREKSNSPLPFAVLFKKNTPTTTVDADFDREFDVEYVHAHQNKELVFNHKPSRTLIEADLMFNLPANEQMSKTDISPTAGFLTKLFVGMMSTKGTATWQKRFLWYGASAGDRAAFNRSVARIDGWDFERIIPCHGDVIEKDGKGVFRKVFEWHLAAAKKSD